MSMDIKLKTLANLPIVVDGIEIKPKTLKDIMKFGYNLYNQCLSIFCFEKEDVAKSIGIEKMDLSHYKYTCALALNESYRDFVLDSLRYFIGKEIYAHDSGILYYFLDKDSPIVLNEESFDKIVEIIKVQNALIQEDDEDNSNSNPANDKVKELLEKRKKVREKLRRAKQKNGDDDNDLTLMELISVVSCNCQGLNIFNVWDLNLFQFNDQFNRMVLLDNYKINIRALLAGAKSEEVDVENWMKKIH